MFTQPNLTTPLLARLCLLQDGRLRTTGLLGCLAAHAIIYIVVETGITHSVVADVEEAAGDDEEGGQQERAGGDAGGSCGGGAARAWQAVGLGPGAQTSGDQRAQCLLAGMEAPVA